MTLSASQFFGLLISILGIAGLSIYTGMKNKHRKAAASGGAGAGITAGIIMGTLVGGSSTVGTAQLAYNYGMSAWWFTLGGGIGCLILALLYTGPMRKSKQPTIIGIIRKEYGATPAMAASVLNSVGTFINVISQLIAATAVLAVVFPKLGFIPALILTAVFMALYVIAGGTRGAGITGILKLVLLYVSMIGCGIIVLHKCGSLGAFRSLVATIDNPENIHFFSLFARGIGKDMSSCLSLILGILTTQTYAQAVLAGKTDASARTGALVSAFLIPPIGAGGILVGLYMRAVAPGIVAKTALTAFAMEYLPGILSGIVLGTLFIAVVGTGAGLAMGISSIIRCDILQRLSDRYSDPKLDTTLSNIIIVVVLGLGCLCSAGPFGDTILSFAFMSMGLRGAVVFIPLCGALFLSHRLNRDCIFAGIILGPTAVLLFGTVLDAPFGIDPLFIGIFLALVCALIGFFVGNRHRAIRSSYLEQLRSLDLNRMVITVDNELCCEAYDVAKLVGEKLHIPVFGKEILYKAAEVSDIPERLLLKFENRPADAYYDILSRDYVGHPLPETSEFVKAQIAGCRALREENGPCILMNHFATTAFADEPNRIAIFMHADREFRASIYSSRRGVGPATTRDALRKADRVFARYYKSNSDFWGRPQYYTFVIDTTDENINEIADAIIVHMESVTGLDFSNGIPNPENNL